MATSMALAPYEQFRPEFEDNYLIAYQQTMARADGLLEKVAINGDFREFPMLAKTNSTRKITQRYEDTAPGTYTTGKRRVVTSPFVSPIIFDRVDQRKFGTLESPIAPTIMNQRAEAARNMDSVIVGTDTEIGGLLGKAIQVDADGVVSYPSFDSTFVIPTNYAYGVSGGPNTGMSVTKLQRVLNKLGKYNVRSQDNTTNNPAAFFLFLGYSQIEDLLNDINLKNRDYALSALEQVQEGKIVDVLGFTIRALDDSVLPISGGIRTCIAGAKNAAKFGYNEMPAHELDKLPTKTHAIQSTFYWDWGVGRIWDEAIWKIGCVEA